MKLNKKRVYHRPGSNYEHIETKGERIFRKMIEIHKIKYIPEARILNYWVDFYFPSSKLIVEIDGETHIALNQLKKDVTKDINLISSGYEVIRIPNIDLYYRDKVKSWVIKVKEIHNRRRGYII